MTGYLAQFGRKFNPMGDMYGRKNTIEPTRVSTQFRFSGRSVCRTCGGSATSNGPSPDFPAWRSWNPSDRSFAFNVADHIRLETLVTLVFAGTLDVIDHEVSHRAFLSSELQA